MLRWIIKKYLSSFGDTTSKNEKTVFILINL